MTNEEVMQLMTDMGLHEGGMDDWVADNAWVKFANAVASAEREACAKVCAEIATEDGWEGGYAYRCVEAIRARGQG
jgi:hypothetical protein